MSIVSIFLALCLFGIVHSNALHQNNEKLSVAEIQRIFHRNAEEVPNYEFVTINDPTERRSKREIRPIELEVDNKKVHLQLTPVDDLVMSRYTPVWTVETDNKNSFGHSYKKIDQVNLDGSYYKDVSKMAMLVASYKDGNIYYDGVFGESKNTKVIRSVKEKWSPENYKSHVVFDAQQENTNTLVINDGSEQSTKRQLEHPLETMYPKLLVIVDYELFKSLNEDVSETFKYVSTFWNAVNLKYSKLTQPKINVMVTGLIINKDETALRYIYDSRNRTDMSQFNHIKLLNTGSSYFEKDFHSEVDFKDYDSTITMIKLGSGALAGSAYPGKICSNTLNVGFVKDDASFSGLLSGTHELGHLLNLPHDEEGAAKSCEGYPEDGISTVMAAYEVSVEKHVWSECSKKILQDFASHTGAECMKYRSRQ